MAGPLGVIEMCFWHNHSVGLTEHNRVVAASVEVYPRRVVPIRTRNVKATVTLLGK